MKVVNFSIVLILIVVISCTDRKTDTELNDTQNDTPELLDENPDISLSSISKRYHSDLVSKLYIEALEKNEVLNKLNDEINDIGNTKNDSIQSYQKYSQTNKDYWITANNYIKQINDSELRESTLEIFKLLESEYQAKISNHEEKLDEINAKTLSLNDQLILLKLSITKSMIANYQVNELPDISILENINREYDRLINEAREFMKDDK